MPPRLSILPNCRFRPSHHHIVASARFHTTPLWHSDNIDYYKALDVPHDASAASIKKQFYALSLRHHPDHNPSDPTAAERFVKISEAYAVLGSPSKRAAYDHETRPHPSHPSRQGSHSSSSTPFGARPASGLSKRRTQFRGPPPSFYRSGGWGSQATKRTAGQEGAGAFHNADTSSNAQNGGGAATSGGVGGGFSPGQAPNAGWNDVPHFDREGHLWTQEQHERRRKRRMEAESAGYERGGGGGLVLNFLFITGVVFLATFWPNAYENAPVARKKKDDG